ncbi:MAG: hypothetical protein OXI87_18525 [Albidovulum sp.]|nr:hypothetical protein [Albidovulum sp.]
MAVRPAGLAARYGNLAYSGQYLPALAVDIRFCKAWRARKANAGAIIARYADDFTVGFRRKRDPEKFLGALRERLGRYRCGERPV